MDHMKAVYELREIVRQYVPVGSGPYHEAHAQIGALKNEIERLKQDEVRRMGT